jgi:hypothetical protein
MASDDFLPVHRDPDDRGPDLPEPDLPEPDRLDRLVTLIDSAISDGGWYQPHRLVMMEPDPESPDEAFLLGQLPLPEGDHPMEHLLGFYAPENWLAFGAVCFGWAAPPVGFDPVRYTVTGRPSQHPDRRRVRVTTLIDRHGAEHCTTALEDGTVIDEPGQGFVGDALRRCLGLPTAPPEVAISELIANWWLLGIVNAGRRLTWKEATALLGDRLTRGARSGGNDPIDEAFELLTVVGWDAIRRRVACGRAPTIDIDPELAAWMDEGMFSRILLSDLPGVDRLLAAARSQLTANVYRRVERKLEMWGVDFVRHDAA